MLLQLECFSKFRNLNRTLEKMIWKSADGDGYA